MGPYRRSHHPLCGPFRADVLVVRGRRYCVACYVGYPALALSLGAGLLLVPATGVPWWAWSLGGLAVAAPQAASFAGRVRSWRWQVAVKLALGAGFGAVLAGLLSAPWPLSGRLLAALAAMSALNALWLFRFHRLERTCRACPQNALRPRCEGLRDLDDRVGHIVRLPQAPATVPSSAAASGWVRVDEGR